MPGSASTAIEALELLREELGPEPALDRGLAFVVLGLTFTQLAEARGMLSGPGLSERLRTPGADAWTELSTHFAELHGSRGGWLFAPERFAALADRRVANRVVHAVVDRLAIYADAEIEILGAIYEATRTLADRRQTSTHYTPRALADQIVARALAPHTRAPESLRVCDPAMGSGVFVLAACRALGERIDHEQGRLIAAQSCVYGVDEDPTAVALARLSLWLEAGARASPFGCFDHALRCGDALVGLSRTQLACADWDLTRGWRARPDALAPTRELGDRVIEAFFSSTRARERTRAILALHRRLDESPQHEWPKSSVVPRPFHWPLEFPHCPSFDAFVGNPPFAGKNSLIAQRGRVYLDWLKQLHPGSHGNADYAAHFFRRADTLLGDDGGTIGFVATNTIGQGDTRTTGLAALVRGGAEIYDVREHLEWPGQANVTVSVVHLARGSVAAGLERRLDGVVVEQIDSRLRPRIERPDPAPLAENRGRAFIGTYVLGRGFVLTPAERDALVAKDPRNAEHIRSYIGGRELNRSPTQAASRCVIDFGEQPLAHAERYPDLLEIIRREVKPRREALADNPDGRRRKAHWWQHGRVTPSLQAALAPLSRCLVTSLVSKHLVFAFVPADQLFSHKLCVFPLEGDADFAVLQSRIHGIWARLLSSTMRNAGLNYSPSDCFETFAWPRTSGDKLEVLAHAGRRLDDARRRYMIEAKVGLTETYDALADRGCKSGTTSRLRELHVEVDRAVVAAYGWNELEAPAYLDAGADFEQSVIDRLYALNSDRS